MYMYTNFGRIQDFHLLGGRKRSCAPTHNHERERQSPLRPACMARVQGLLKGPGSSRGGGGGEGASHVICLIWALFLSILIQNEILKNIVAQNWGRARLLRPL